MEATMTLGAVLTCTVEHWSYNVQRHWMAPDITVGDVHPECDTFTTGAASPTEEHPRVELCNVTAWAFNDARSWRANGVTVSDHSEHADCLTFRVRQ